MRTHRQALAELKAAHNHPTYAKMAFAVGCGIQKRGSRCHVFDEAGRAFLALFDQYGNQSFGYCHPRLVTALQEQLATSNLNSTKIMFEEVQIRLTARLSELTGGRLPFAYLANGGGESIDNALKLAWAATRRSHFITAIDCFHGKTIATLSAARRPEHEAVYGPMMGEFRQVPFGDLAAMDAAVDERTAAVLLEPVQAEGGVIVPPADYLRQVRRLCSERGALLILDEMQTAFGRCGTFFAFEQLGAVPDLMCIGKAFGGGLVPISAVLGTREVWASLERVPSTFGSSLGGNPLSCAVGLAAAELAAEPSFLTRVNDLAAVLNQRLSRLAERFPALISAHRGMGMMHGLEFGDEALGGLVLQLLIEHQVTSTYSLYNNRVLRVQPPMVIEDDELAHGLDVVEAVLETIQEYQAHGGRTGLQALPPLELSINLPCPAPKARELLARQPHLLDPFSLIHDRECGPPVDTEFTGTLGHDQIIWTDRVEPTENGVTLRAGDCWMWAELSRSFIIAETSERTCRVDICIQWDAGTGGYEALLAGGISYFVTNRVRELAVTLATSLTTITSPASSQLAATRR